MYARLGTDQQLECRAGTFPFTSRTEHNDQYYEKPRMARPAEPLTLHAPAGALDGQTDHESSTLQALQL